MIRNLALLTLMLIGATPASACTIPVFRYALERWALTPYEIMIFSKDALPAEAETFVKNLEEKPTANLEVTRVAVDGKLTKAQARIWKKLEGQATLPWMVIRSPDADESLHVYSGPISASVTPPLIDSPKRQELVKRLQTGETSVFILLESGDAKADQEAYEFLQRDLARLTKLLKIPDQGTDGPQLKTNLPLKIEFSIMRLAQTEAKEAGFVQLLLSTEEDLTKVKGPIVFPVFGRGRVLCSLFGNDLESKQLNNVTRFLCGECSCQVKELNPGVDLLLTTNWAEFLDRASNVPALLVPKEPGKNK